MADNHVIQFLKKDTDAIAYFGIFDGHGGPEASAFCRDNLLNEIIKYDGFWTDDDDKVLDAIRKGFLDTHHAMWNVLDSWPKSVIGISLAGTTATITIIKQGKLYSGHVGHSAIVLGENDLCGGENLFQAICLTKDHKPDDPDERLRIEDSGGKVIVKSGVPRVASRKPRSSHDKFPTLAVARSLGDLWSFDHDSQKYLVSPDPDVGVLKLDPNKHRCLVLASDGLWNVLTPKESVNLVMDLEAKFEQEIITDPNVDVSLWSNSAEQLVSKALERWQAKALIADNTSCVVVVIDTLQPSELTLFKKQRQELSSGGEMPRQLNEMPQCPGEMFGDKNTSLHEAHVSVIGDSMIQPVDQEPNVHGCSLIGSKSAATTECTYESIDCSAEIESADSLKNNRHFLQRIPPHPTVHLRRLINIYSSGSQKQRDGHVGTEFFDNHATASGNDRLICKGVKEPRALEREMTVESKVKDGMKKPWALRREKTLEIDVTIDGIHCFKDHDNSIKLVGDSELLENSLPQPPPHTPRSEAKDIDRDNESDISNSFSLASDERIESPGWENDHPPATDGHVFTEHLENHAATSGKDIQIYKWMKKPWALKREMAIVSKGKIGMKNLVALNREMTVGCKGKDIMRTPWALRREKRLEIIANNRWYKWLHRL